MRSLDLGLYELSTNEKFVVGWGGGVGWGRLGVIIESNRNRVRLSCCWVGVGLGCDNNSPMFDQRVTGFLSVTFI